MLVTCTNTWTDPHGMLNVVPHRHHVPDNSPVAVINIGEPLTQRNGFDLDHNPTVRFVDHNEQTIIFITTSRPK